MIPRLFIHSVFSSYMLFPLLEMTLIPSVEGLLIFKNLPQIHSIDRVYSFVQQIFTEMLPSSWWWRSVTTQYILRILSYLWLLLFSFIDFELLKPRIANYSSLPFITHFPLFPFPYIPRAWWWLSHRRSILHNNGFSKVWLPYSVDSKLL